MAYSDTMKVYPQISENLWFNINQEGVRLENVEFSLCVCIWKITKVCFNIFLPGCSMHFKYNLHWIISTLSFIDNQNGNKITVNRNRIINLKWTSWERMGSIFEEQIFDAFVAIVGQFNWSGVKGMCYVGGNYIILTTWTTIKRFGSVWHFLVKNLFFFL